MSRKVEVVDYDPEWNKRYREEGKKIKTTFGKNVRGIYHIGSTSVKGMKAKPIIDIMVAVRKGTLDEIPYDRMEELGYECKGENGIPRRRFFVKGGEHPVCHVHVFEESNVKEIRRHLALKGYLESKPEEREAYSTLKEALAKQYPESIEDYCKGKEAFLEELEKKALQWQDKQEELGKYMSMGMCIGIAVGCAVGYVLFDMIIGMGIGMCIGMALGYAAGRRKIGE